MKIISHKVCPKRCIEEVIIEDSHGRQKHIHVGLFDGHDIDAVIQREIDEFEAQEEMITNHIETRFHPETLERKHDV